MGRPLKTRKYQQDTGVTVDYGFPNDGTTSNDWNDNNPGITGGYDGAIRVTANFLMNGQGTISAASNDATVTGTGTDFQYCGIEVGSLIYVNGTLLGEVDSITNGTSLELTGNAAATVTGSTWTFTRGPRNAYILRQKGKKIGRAHV